MQRSRSPRVVVLDTSCVRGTPQPALKQLIAEGFALQISGIALLELAVHFSNATEPKTIALLRARLSFLADIVPGGIVIAPTHAPLLGKLGGRMIGVGMPEDAYQTWQVSMRRVWDYAVSGDDVDDIRPLLAQMASFVTRGGQGFLHTMGTIAMLGDPTRRDLEAMDEVSGDLAGLLAHIHLPGVPSASQRLDAYARMFGLHMKRAFGRSVGRYATVEENDAGDLDLLQHLAEGVLVATRDYKLIEALDASGTRQAPWLRTVGELLDGRAPTGKPFAESARRAAAKHRARTRQQLAELDRQAERQTDPTRASDVPWGSR